MPDWIVWAFIPAIGFVAAGLVCALVRFAVSHQAGFGMLRDFPGGILPAIIISMFAGPWLVASLTFERWRQGQSSPAAAAAPFLTLLWSFCSGVFIIELLIWIGLVTV